MTYIPPTWDELAGELRLDTRQIQDAADDLRSDLEIDERTPSEEEQAFLNAVDELAGEVGDWQYGETLIREDSFEDYARELAEDIGAIASDAQWPTYCIDWERAARELAMDYSLVTFLGHDYYVRS